jgi:hypothetical protein
MLPHSRFFSTAIFSLPWIDNSSIFPLDYVFSFTYTFYRKENTYPIIASKQVPGPPASRDNGAIPERGKDCVERALMKWGGASPIVSSKFFFCPSC